MNWLPIDQAPENVVVETKVDDGRDGRYRLRLVRRGSKWYQPGGDGFVFYRPTHFRFPVYENTGVMTTEQRAARSEKLKQSWVDGSHSRMVRSGNGKRPGG